MGLRIGIFGGSFDPIHVGHLILADTCREQLELDRVLLVPTATSPLKLSGPRASDAARSEMVRLAIAGTETLELETLEIERGGVSYTIETVAALEQRWPGDELVLLMGADAIATLELWHQPAELLRRVPLGVVLRGGEPAPDFARAAELLDEPERAGFSPRLVPMPEIRLSSTELRQRIAAGRSIRFRTPRAVEEYIAANGLYRGG
ncbi:nicotinate (nicotinamide) nucleotide adenylyltransferase [Candidatus Laterigemmans baculatus]|uniref:nicotinate (nicotinamide) nucleotide adenylyltransferase n=1 Tax=Candidatus Laterigemmans baculatus TaxID=2770505 RepID=UPI001F0253CC|nr:nicotinate (nicotinamide) nucleotide adenylyltransferase [Candidatus Laterigemmans baculatus]